ncbi:redoxin family protein [Granulicella sibirica]|uniref:Redoxin domain protein n=1 Tax=Granulicella sibirica TaxID=2479048 RepID=A0A4Q0SYN2_9BACT|nr:redoxin family protein [Granulicella sibirica]RXH54311.1 Redoxin domain protein [Granulicella sibirica]
MAAMLHRLTLVLLVVAATVSYAQHPAAYGRALDGNAVTDLARPSTKAVVLFFVASECPISNRTFPEMKRVREAFVTADVRFWFVYPNADETPEAVRAHQASFDPGGEVLLDPDGRLTHLTGATTTPEVAVLLPNGSSWKPVYVGRIDDRYVRLGIERPQATEHFAERILREVLDGKPVERATGSPVGCSIMSASFGRGMR